MTEHERLVEAVAQQIYEATPFILAPESQPRPWAEMNHRARKSWRKQARAALAAVATVLDAMGWVCVPREATTEMVNAIRGSAGHAIDFDPDGGWSSGVIAYDICAAYRAATVAAPRSPLEGKDAPATIPRTPQPEIAADEAPGRF